MNNRIVIFLRNNIEKFDKTINEISRKAPFEVEYILYDTLTTEKYINLLKKTSQTQVYFCIDPVFYQTVEKKLTTYLKSIYELPFRNFIFIHSENRFMQKDSFTLGNSLYFYFSNKLNIEHQVNYFIIFQIQLFQKAVISKRLSAYISDSFKEVVYSEILVKKNKEIEHLYKELEEKNKIDYLTNLYNRKALYSFLENERKRTLRGLWRLYHSSQCYTKQQFPKSIMNYTNQPCGDFADHFGIYSILMIDIDNFKFVNDTYGHIAGDHVLRTLGDLIIHQNVFRDNDIAGRFGGEEFIIILPETNAHNALIPATRLLEKFRNIAFSDNKGGTFFVSLSIGISEYNPEDKADDDIILRADKALYHAKDHGKSKVVVYENVFAVKNDM